MKKQKNKNLILAAAVGLVTASALSAALLVSAASPPQVVTENDLADTPDLSSWFFYNDENDTINNSLGSFVDGPDTAPLGSGSAQISVTGTERRNLATYQFSGTPLADITELKFSTYNPSAGNGGSANRSAYLNFNVDFNGSDTWQRRLVYVPSDNGAVQQDTWQEWDALNGGDALWKYSGPTWPGTTQAGSATKTWDQILADYPGVRVRVSDSWLGLRVGEPYANGYTENIDKFVFGTVSETKVFDFEPLVGPPTDKNACKNDGWKTFNNPAYKNQGLCVKDVQSNS